MEATRVAVDHGGGQPDSIMVSPGPQPQPQPQPQTQTQIQAKTPRWRRTGRAIATESESGAGASEAGQSGVRAPGPARIEVSIINALAGRRVLSSLAACGCLGWWWSANYRTGRARPSQNSAAVSHIVTVTAFPSSLTQLAMRFSQSLLPCVRHDQHRRAREERAVTQAAFY